MNSKDFIAELKLDLEESYTSLIRNVNKLKREVDQLSGDVVRTTLNVSSTHDLVDTHLTSQIEQDKALVGFQVKSLRAVGATVDEIQGVLNRAVEAGR